MKNDHVERISKQVRRIPTEAEKRRWSETDAFEPEKAAPKPATPNRELTKTEPIKTRVVLGDDSDGDFALSVLEGPNTSGKLIEPDSDENNTDWQKLVTAQETVKIVHKPNKSQKAFEITITDRAGKEKALLVYVKRNNKDLYNKGGNTEVEDNFNKCLVTFAGSEDLTKMAGHLKNAINKNLGDKTGEVEYFNEKNRKDDYETEIARYSVGQSYNDTVVATQKALEAYVETLNSHGLVSAVLKDDVVIHAERESQLDSDSLAKLVTEAFMYDQDCLTAVNNLQIAAQLPVTIKALDDIIAITGTGTINNTIGAATRQRIEILTALETLMSEEIPERVTKAIMEEVNRIRPKIGKRSLPVEKVNEIVSTIVSRQIDAEEYGPRERKYVDKAINDISKALSDYINNGITEGKAFPRERNEFPSDSKKTQMII